MTKLFNSEKLNTTRYISIATAILPIVLIFAIGSTVFPPGSGAGQNVVGRPSSTAFPIVWSILVILWTLLIIIASFHFESTSLIVFQVFSLLTLVCIMLWLWLYHDNNKEVAAQILLLTLLFAFLMVVVCLTSKEMNLISGCFSVPLVVWLGGATLFNYLEVNNPI